MHQMLRRIRAETATGNYFYFHLELNAAYLRMLKLTCGAVRDACGHFRNSSLKTEIHFFIDVIHSVAVMTD